jgi:hypothetical protein
VGFDDVTDRIARIPPEVRILATRYVIGRAPEDADLLLEILGLTDSEHGEVPGRGVCKECGSESTLCSDGERRCGQCDALKERNRYRKANGFTTCSECGSVFTLLKSGYYYCRPCNNTRNRRRDRETGRVTGAGSGSANRSKTCCPRCGGGYTLNRNGSRYCKLCSSSRERARRAERKAISV